MGELTEAKGPFRFYTRLHLSELTGLKARNLGDLVRILKEVSGSSVYHHTHRFLQQHQYLSPEPPNDFAYWVTEVLGEHELGEKLASIDTVRFMTIEDLRNNIITVITGYLKERPYANNRFTGDEEAFHFIKSLSFVVPTDYYAKDLGEFVDVLKNITIDSIYFHIFEARLRLHKRTNDFSYWIEDSLGDKELADKLAKLDPYTQTLEDLRKSIIRIVQKRIQ